MLNLNLTLEMLKRMENSAGYEVLIALALS